MSVGVLDSAHNPVGILTAVDINNVPNSPLQAPLFYVIFFQEVRAYVPDVND